jgi:N-acetylmuramoyl-L-alanine amidase
MLRFFLCLYIALLWTSVSGAQFRIMIDPGHGGSDLGATRDSFIESKIVLSIADKLKAELENENVEVVLTRENDSHLSLQQRVQMANENNADLFLSLHANWSRSTQVSGFEFYFASQQNQSRGANESHLSKPDEIIEKIKADLTLLGRQKLSLEFSQQAQQQVADQKSVIRRAPFYVIENTTMPAVLIEVGFISNRREAKKLASPEYQSEIAALLTKSVLSYKQTTASYKQKTASYKEKSDKKLSLNEK